MVDYAKKTVAELQEILKSRSLPSSGKKADLVARLAEADKAAEENAEIKAPPAEATTAPPAQTAEAVAESTQIPVAAVASTASQPTAGEAAAASPSANTDTALAQSASYALNLPQSDVDAELAKRKARAARFGTGTANGEETESKDDEAAKTLERAKRFGTGTTTMGKLDEALPSERERGARKRARDDGGAEVSSALDDPALRRGFRGRGGGGGGRGHRGGRDGERRDNSRRRGERPTGVQKSGGGGAYTSEKDRLAAEARKKRFTTAS